MIILVIIACVDEKGGMLFNNRRQSKDKELINRFNKEEYFNPMINLLTDILRVSDAAWVS